MQPEQLLEGGEGIAGRSSAPCWKVGNSSRESHCWPWQEENNNRGKKKIKGRCAARADVSQSPAEPRAGGRRRAVLGRCPEWAAPGEPPSHCPPGPPGGMSRPREAKDKTAQSLWEPHYSNSSRSSERTAVTLGEAQSYLQGE